MRSSDNDSNSTTQTSTTEKKSSFATDKWLAQRDAGKKIEVWCSKQDEVSSQNVSQLNTVNTTSDSSSARQLAGPNWSRSEHSRSRSRSPLNDVQSKVQAHSSRMSHRSHSPSVHPRQVEERREWQSKQSSAESTRTSARHSTYVTERESSSRPSSSYCSDREPFTSGSNVHHPPLKSALRKHTGSVEQKPASSSATATYGREQDMVSCNVQRYQQIDRNAYYLSQMRSAPQ